MSTCFECGDPAEHDHHVVPRSRGGTKTVPLCGPCHAKAHDMDCATLAAESGRTGTNWRETMEWNPGATPPFGFREADGRLVVEPFEERLVDLAVAMRRDGMHWTEIAEELNAAGLLVRGRRCSHELVRRVVLRWHPDLATGSGQTRVRVGWEAAQRMALELVAAGTSKRETRRVLNERCPPKHGAWSDRQVHLMVGVPRTVRIRLDAGKAQEVRSLREAGAVVADLARRFGVAPSTIRRVLAGEAWS